MKKTFVLLLTLSFIVAAQSAGNTGLSFLKLGFGARNIAMGDLGVTGISDVTALHYNPALLSKMKTPQLMFAHNEYIQDTRSESAGGSLFIYGLPFAVGVNTTSIDDIEVRTKPGEAEATFNANYFSSSLSTAFSVYDNVYIGVTAKFIHESMLTYKADGFGFDFGVLYTNLFEGLELGASMRNIGSMSEFDEEESTLPTDVRVGAAYNLEYGEGMADLMFTAGYQKYTDTDDNHFHLGLEYGFKDMIFLRGGYFTGYESKSFSGGFGVNYFGISFDYAFMPFDYDLGSSHILSMHYSFE